ncbi:MAG TPA: NfeD family protein [Actinomycetota bacterium]|nr:NfeD family protein [Actinomycetota bacterium]
MGRSRSAGRAKAVVALLGSAFLAGLLSAVLAPSASAAGSHGSVLTLSVNGPVDPFEATFIKRGIEAAEADGDPAVVLVIDTSGGLDSSMRQAVSAIQHATVPVLCYVPAGARAASAGTFLMFACPVSGMAPGTWIGAAEPVGFGGVVASSKTVGRDATLIGSLATALGRNAADARSFVRSSTSLGAAQALSSRDTDFEPATLAQFLRFAGCSALDAKPTTGSGGTCGPVPASGAQRNAGYPVATSGAPVTAFAMTPGERIFHAFANPSVAFLLLDVAFVALLIWAFHPGFHPPLAVGITSLALSLAILETLPVRLVGFGLLVIAAALIALELRARSHGILTASGVVVLIVGGLLLFNPAVPHARVSPGLLIAIPILLGIASFFMLRAIGEAKAEPLRAGVGALVGELGTAKTALSPKGRVQLRGESWSAVTVEGDVPAGTPVRVVGVSGLTLEVMPEPQPEGPAVGVQPKGDLPWAR